LVALRIEFFTKTSTKNKIEINSKGNKYCEFKKHNLHVVGYSIPINKKVSKVELFDHLYSRPDLPNAIPYVTSYYTKRWGFCISEEEKNKLIDDEYNVYIDSSFKKGKLNYGEVVIKGRSKREIFFSTYLCHPQMANNELSGPVLMSQLIKYVTTLKNRNFTYRFIFIPETIGSIVYLSRNIKKMKKNISAGFVLTCVGDKNEFSFLPSRKGNTLADKVAKKILKDEKLNFKQYTFLDRGSDERQYCSPGVDLPICSIMRSKYGAYREYHTSLDNLNFVSEEGLYSSFLIYQKVILALENNNYYLLNTKGEPQLGKRDLYPDLGTNNQKKLVENMMNTLTYMDGTNDLIDISNLLNIEFEEVLSIVSMIIAKDKSLLKKL
jgi:aminopeptidase-like protein